MKCAGRGLGIFILFLVAVNRLSAQINIVPELKDSVLQLTITLNKGWHLYGASKALDAAFVNSEMEGIRFSKLEVNGTSQPITDQAFQEKMTVFTGILHGTTTLQRLPDGINVLPVTFHGYISDGETFLPIEKKLLVQTGAAKSKTRIVIPGMQTARFRKSNPLEEGSTSMLKVFFLGLLGGLVALITPCVFPMIPVTISFFGSRAASKKQSVKMGTIYGSAILLIYMLASVPFHVLGKVRPELLNNISTSVWLNLIFFLVFLFFALSLFGVFNLRLPASLANKADQKGGFGSMAGIFFLALTLVIVSFSCTGPILGSLLVGSLQGSGGAWLLTAGMAGFGVALGLPFALFAIFPQMLSQLPKSGNWLSIVKVSLGFLELALAFKFLSNADLVMQWGLLKREIFLGIWLLIAVAWLLYTINAQWWLRYGQFNISKGRSVLAVLLTGLIVYLGYGLAGRPLKGLSGFAPPAFYSLKDHGREIKLEADLNNDYEKALEKARATNKKLLIDFTGWACVNCRKMEEQVWSDPAVAEKIRTNFVLVSLYVDDKNKLPANAQVFGFVGRDKTVKDIITIGDLYAAMEAENLGQVSQPLYAIVDANENLLQEPVGYTPAPAKFLNWLEAGLRINGDAAARPPAVPN
jgi:thiol:disulfide interchange protein